MTSHSRRLLAAVLLLTMIIPSVWADDDHQVPECSLRLPPPEGSLRLVWRGPNGEEAPGTWVSDVAMKRVAVRQNTCIDGWARCEVDLSTTKAKTIRPGWKAWAIGIGAGVAIGFVAGVAIGIGAGAIKR